MQLKWQLGFNSREKSKKRQKGTRTRRKKSSVRVGGCAFSSELSLPEASFSLQNILFFLSSLAASSALMASEEQIICRHLPLSVCVRERKLRSDCIRVSQHQKHMSFHFRFVLFAHKQRRPPQSTAPLQRRLHRNRADQTCFAAILMPLNDMCPPVHQSTS